MVRICDFDSLLSDIGPSCNEAVLDFTLQWTDVCPEFIKFLSFICSISQGDKAKKQTMEIELRVPLVNKNCKTIV